LYLQNVHDFLNVLKDLTELNVLKDLKNLKNLTELNPLKNLKELNAPTDLNPLKNLKILKKQGLAFGPFQTMPLRWRRDLPGFHHFHLRRAFATAPHPTLALATNG
jgi:hypothetical protein